MYVTLKHAGIALCLATLMVLAGRGALGASDPAVKTTPVKVTPINPLTATSTVKIFRDDPSKASLASGPEGCISVKFQLEPVHDWGSWVTMVAFDNAKAPLDMSAFESLVVSIHVQEACSAPTTLRLSIYDVDADGAFEWYYAADTDVLKKATDGWVRIVFPLESFRRAPSIWGGPVNDYKLDLKRIGKVELSLVTSTQVLSKGVFLMKELGLVKKSASGAGTVSPANSGTNAVARNEAAFAPFRR